MENKPNVWKSGMNFGALLGLAMVIYSLIVWFLGATNNTTASIISWVIMLGGIVYAMIYYRNTVLGRTMTYGQSVGIGTLTAFFASIISGFFTFILIKYIDPGILEEAMLTMEEKMLEQGMDPDMVEQQMEMSERFTGPLTTLLGSVFGGTLIGLIFSLIASIFTKREPNPFEDGTNQ